MLPQMALAKDWHIAKTKAVFGVYSFACWLLIETSVYLTQIVRRDLTMDLSAVYDGAWATRIL